MKFTKMDEGLEVETASTGALAHYIGVAVVILALSVLVYAVRWW